jgi:hypothetical protein
MCLWEVGWLTAWRALYPVDPWGRPALRGSAFRHPCEPSTAVTGRVTGVSSAVRELAVFACMCRVALAGMLECLAESGFGGNATPRCRNPAAHQTDGYVGVFMPLETPKTPHPPGVWAKPAPKLPGQKVSANRRRFWRVWQTCLCYPAGGPDSTPDSR